MLDTEKIRLECLKLAQGAEGMDQCGNEQGARTESVTERARAYADFVLARNDGPVLRAANELTKAVNQ